MIKDEYCNFETAKLLKEKEFDEPCDHFYRSDKPNDIFVGSTYKNSEIGGILSKVYNTCTQSLAMRWLREIHNIYINAVWYQTFEQDKQITFICFVTSPSFTPHDNAVSETRYDTYEEAIEHGIVYALKNLIK